MVSPQSRKSNQLNPSEQNPYQPTYELEPQQDQLQRKPRQLAVLILQLYPSLSLIVAGLLAPTYQSTQGAAELANASLSIYCMAAAGSYSIALLAGTLRIPGVRPGLPFVFCGALILILTAEPSTRVGLLNFDTPTLCAIAGVGLLAGFYAGYTVEFRRAIQLAMLSLGTAILVSLFPIWTLAWGVLAVFLNSRVIDMRD